MFVVTATTQAHVARLPAEVGARDRGELVIAAYKGGFVSRSR